MSVVPHLDFKTSGVLDKEPDVIPDLAEPSILSPAARRKMKEEERLRNEMMSDVDPSSVNALFNMPVRRKSYAENVLTEMEEEDKAIDEYITKKRDGSKTTFHPHVEPTHKEHKSHWSFISNNLHRFEKLADDLGVGPGLSPRRRRASVVSFDTFVHEKERSKYNEKQAARINYRLARLLGPQHASAMNELATIDEKKAVLDMVKSAADDFTSHRVGRQRYAHMPTHEIKRSIERRSSVPDVHFSSLVTQLMKNKIKNKINNKNEDGNDKNGE